MVRIPNRQVDLKERENQSGLLDEEKVRTQILGLRSDIVLRYIFCNNDDCSFYCS